jgi:NAD(P)-dependent dehydrogenase (short-subunit alcohol dehydrogenase family)
MGLTKHPVALITGGSRGVGAAAALALAERGCDVAIIYRNKAARAAEVVAKIMQRGRQALAVGCDITQQADLERLFAALKDWSGYLDLLILNAAGGLERDLVAADPQYPMRINRDAQLALVDGALPLMLAGGVIIHVTSQWAHLHGQVASPPVYAPIAETKYAGEQALRARQEEFTARNIRLIVVTGDLIEDTIMARLLERTLPGLSEERRGVTGQLPTATEMGEAIATAAMDFTLPSGHTVVVGGGLDTFLSQNN